MGVGRALEVVSWGCPEQIVPWEGDGRVRRRRTDHHDMVGVREGQHRTSGSAIQRSNCDVNALGQKRVHDGCSQGVVLLVVLQALLEDHLASEWRCLDPSVDVCKGEACVCCIVGALAGETVGQVLKVTDGEGAAEVAGSLCRPYEDGVVESAQTGETCWRACPCDSAGDCCPSNGDCCSSCGYD